MQLMVKNALKKLRTSEKKSRPFPFWVLYPIPATLLLATFSPLRVHVTSSAKLCGIINSEVGKKLKCVIWAEV